MSISRTHPKGTPAPFFRVTVQPTGRGPIFIGEFGNRDDAERADDDARLWLHHLLLLRCAVTTGWHDARRAYRVLVIHSEPLPVCPERLAAWLRRRGWDIPAPRTEKRPPPAPIVDQFLRRIAALQSGIEKLEQRLSPASDSAAPPTDVFVI